MNYFFIFIMLLFFDLKYAFQHSEAFSISSYINNTYSNKNEKKPKKILENINNNYVKLNTTNVVSLKGVINGKSVNRFLYEFSLINKDNLYIYIDSPGGSVEDGYKIITELQKYNVSCIVDKAYSMAFAILQVCHNRYLLPHGKIMQHQISLGIMNELGKIESYLSFISQIENELLKIQSNKIGISSEELKNKSSNEWWMFGETALKENCVDKIINIECSKNLIKETYIINDGMNDYIYSKCPLIPNYLEKIKNNKNSKDFVFYI